MQNFTQKNLTDNKTRLFIHIKYLLLIGYIMINHSLSGLSQGLEGFIVEKYYVANSIDASDEDGGSLANESVTYRLFVDMLPGYKLQAVYGIPRHELVLQTSTLFFNNNDRGAEKAEMIGSNRVDDNTVGLDSWISVGGASGGHIAVLKSEDTNGSILGTGTLLKNTDPYAGIPLTTADGLIPGVPVGTTTVGVDFSTWFGLDAGNTGPRLSTFDGSWAPLGGFQGPTPSNTVLIAQVTTNGIFHFEINVQIASPEGVIEKYVTSNAKAHLSETYAPFLINTVGKSINPPVITITSPTESSVFSAGQIITIETNASDPDGTVDSVEFIINDIKVGTSKIPPFNYKWIGSQGVAKMKAVAIDNQGARKVSPLVTFTVTAAVNAPPTINITTPISGSQLIPGETISIQTSAADIDGSVDSVEFFVNNTKIGTDKTYPFSINWMAVEGNVEIVACAIDNDNAKTCSQPVNVSVLTNVNPAVLKEANFKVYPNPTKDIIKVEVKQSTSSGIINYSIFNVLGTVILNGKMDYENDKYPIEIDLSTYPKGLYYLKLSVDNENYTKAIIRN